MKKYLFIIIYIFSINFSLSQTKYYQDQDGKILSTVEYNLLKQKLKAEINKNKNEKFIENIVELKRNKDSIIYSYDIYGIDKFFLKQKKKQNKLIGSKFPLNELIESNGNKFDFENKTTVINFWFTQCEPCLNEIPVLNEIKSEFSEKVNFIAITFDTKEKVQQLLTKVKFDFIQYTDANKIIKQLKINGYPQIFLLDKNGIILSIEDGIEYSSINGGEPKIGDGKYLKEKIKKLL